MSFVGHANMLYVAFSIFDVMGGGKLLALRNYLVLNANSKGFYLFIVSKFY